MYPIMVQKLIEFKKLENNGLILGSVTYINRGFISLQLALDTSFIEMTSKQELPIIMLQEFPYPPYLNDLGFTDMFLYVLPIVTIFSFVFLCPAVIKRVVEEKQTGIKVDLFDCFLFGCLNVIL